MWNESGSWNCNVGLGGLADREVKLFKKVAKED